MLKNLLNPKLILNLVISVVIVFALFHFADLNVLALVEQIKATDLFWFGLTVLACLIQIFTNAFRWNLLSKLLDYPVSYFKALNWYFQGMFANSFIPTNFGGDALRGYLLGKEKRDWFRAAGTVLMERLLGFLLMFSTIPIGLLFLNMDSARCAQVPSQVLYALMAIFISAALAVLTYRLWREIPLKPIQKIKFAVKEYTQCRKSIAKVIAWTLITHTFLITANVFAAKSIGISISEIPIWYWFILVPTAILAGFLIPAMKGLGPKEASYVYFLGLIGVDPEKSLAIGFVMFAATLIASLPGVSIAFHYSELKKPLA